MNVKWKIILLVMLLISSACILFASLFIAENRKHIEDAMARDIESIERFIKVLEESRYQGYQGRIKTFLNYKASRVREEMLRSFEAGERAQLYKKSYPFYKVLKRENPYFSTLSWITPDNRNFLRVHKPEGVFLDDITQMRPDIVLANQARTPVNNYMVAKSGLQYRLIHPVFYEQRYLGLVQFGVDIQLLLDSIRRELHTPVGIVIPNDKAKYIKNKKISLVSGEVFSILSEKGSRLPDLSSVVWEKDRQTIYAAGKKYILANAFDFLNHQGESQGRLFIAMDVTAQEETLQSQLTFVIVISLAVLLLSFAVLYPSYGKLMGQIVMLNDRLRKHNDELEKTVDERTESLAQSNERFEKLSSLTFEGILLHDRGIALDVNESLQQMFGYDRSEMIGKDMLALLIPEQYHPVVRENIVQPSPPPYEVEARKKDGTLFHVEVVSRQIQDGEDSYRVTALRDVTRRKEAEAALVGSEQRYQLLADSTFEAIFFSEGGICVDQNQTAEDLFGYTREEAIGRPGVEWIVPDDRESVSRNMLNAMQSPYQAVALRKDGSTFPCEIQAKMMALDGKVIRVTALRDITDQRQAEQEQRNLEQQLRQKFKMEAVGMMAGGIAHNFNNGLAIVLSSLEMARRRITQPEKVESYIENAYTAVLRSRDLVKQIMTYSRADIHEAAPVQMSVIIDETLNLLRSTSPSTIRIDCRSEEIDNEVVIHADPGRIQEVLLNLYTNAVHAMDESGVISIGLERVELEQGDIPAQYESSPGPYAKLTFTDDGCGMNADVLEKMFDPFYTTKEINKGTGMGLSTVQGIVDQHGGLIKVQSEKGKGTTFEIFFPVTEREDQDLSVAADGGEIPPGGTEQILLVDDEEALIELASELLIELGYRVQAVTSSQEAIDMIQKDPSQFDLVVTDQTMPELTGQELALEIGNIRKDLPVVLCTGYSSKVSAEDIANYNISAFCKKPLGMTEFSCIVREVLDRNKNA